MKLHHASLLLIYLSLFLTFKAQATIELTSVGGAYSTYDDSETSPVIYGGFAGTSCGAGPCSNCDSSASICNERRVSETDALQFTLKSSEALGTLKILGTKNGTDSEIDNGDGGTISSANGIATVTVDWSEICNLNTTSANDSCADAEDNGIYTLKAGVDDDNDGTLEDSLNIKVQVQNTIEASFASDCDTSNGSDNSLCEYTIVPGDKKIFISVLGADDDSWPELDDISIDRVALFYEELEPTDSCVFSNITLANDKKTYDIDDIDDGSFSYSKSADGFNNDKRYCTRMAAIDQAGNIGMLASAASLNDNDHSAVPSEVFGLLEKGNCFIASASFGSASDPKLHILRNFRDQILAKHQWGQNFIKLYYAHSYQLAVKLLDKPFVKSIVRIVLWPLIAFAYLSLKLGFIAAIVVTTLSLFLIINLISILFKKLSKRKLYV